MYEPALFLHVTFLSNAQVRGIQQLPPSLINPASCVDLLAIRLVVMISVEISFWWLLFLGFSLRTTRRTFLSQSPPGVLDRELSIANFSSHKWCDGQPDAQDHKHECVLLSPFLKFADALGVIERRKGLLLRSDRDRKHLHRFVGQVVEFTQSFACIVHEINGQYQRIPRWASQVEAHSTRVSSTYPRLRCQM